MTPICYYDTHRIAFDEPIISFSDRAVFFGDAVYDACLVKNRMPYLLDPHLDRFYTGCKALGINPKKNRDELSSLIFSLCNDITSEIAFLYFQASRSAPTRRHFAEKEDESHLLIFITEMKIPQREQCLSLIIQRDCRYELCNLKTTNLLPAVLASTRAKEAGADEAVFVREGKITECAHSNISILKNGTLYTHPKGPHILPGIARERLLLTCKALQIPVLEQPFSVKELLQADEILVTSTTKLCQRARMLMGRPIGMKDEMRANSIQSAIFLHFNNCDIAQ